MHADGKSTLVSVSKWKSGKVNCKTNSRQRDQSRSPPALITKCSLCRRTYGITQYVTGSCSGVPKGKLLQNRSKYGRLPITAKQQLANAIPFKLKITHRMSQKIC